MSFIYVIILDVYGPSRSCAWCSPVHSPSRAWSWFDLFSRYMGILLWPVAAREIFMFCAITTLSFFMTICFWFILTVRTNCVSDFWSRACCTCNGLSGLLLLMHMCVRSKLYASIDEETWFLSLLIIIFLSRFLCSLPFVWDFNPRILFYVILLLLYNIIVIDYRVVIANDLIAYGNLIVSLPFMRGIGRDHNCTPHILGCPLSSAQKLGATTSFLCAGSGYRSCSPRCMELGATTSSHYMRGILLS